MITLFQKQFSTELIAWFTAKRTTYMASQAADPLFFLLFDFVQEISCAGGKRIRPYVAQQMYRGIIKGKSLPDISPLLAVELFHIFGLIHDDIIDNGKQRHGVSTIHTRMQEYYEKQGIGKSESRELGKSQALLIGDLVYAWCHELLDESAYSDAIRKQVKKQFTTMSETVMVGQMIDVDMTASAQTTMDRIIKKMILKTATYTFVYPMQIGVLLAEGDEEALNFATEFGTNIGLAFQIQDDILDVIGNSQKTGKQTFRDMAEGQHTLLTQYIVDNGTAEEKELLEKYFATKKSYSQNEKELLETLFTDSGAVLFARDIAKEYLSKAEKAIEKSSLANTTKDSFRSLITYITNRYA